MDFSLPCTITFFGPVTITFHSSWLDTILGQVMSDLYHVLLDLGTITFQPLNITLFTLRMQCLLNILRRLSYLIPGNWVLFIQSPRCLYNNLQRLVGPTILYNGHKKNAAKSWHNFLIYICRCLIQSYLFFGIIKLIVHAPRGRCLDRDFCCEIAIARALHVFSTASVPIKT